MVGRNAEILNPESQTPNPKPQTRPPKLQTLTLNPEPRTGSIMVGWQGEPAFVGKFQMVQGGAVKNTETLDRPSDE
jgi:hypothetical protein